MKRSHCLLLIICFCISSCTAIENIFKGLSKKYSDDTENASHFFLVKNGKDSLGNFFTSVDRIIIAENSDKNARYTAIPEDRVRLLDTGFDRQIDQITLSPDGKLIAAVVDEDLDSYEVYFILLETAAMQIKLSDSDNVVRGYINNYCNLEDGYRSQIVDWIANSPWVDFDMNQDYSIEILDPGYSESSIQSWYGWDENSLPVFKVDLEKRVDVTQMGNKLSMIINDMPLLAQPFYLKYDREGQVVSCSHEGEETVSLTNPRHAYTITTENFANDRTGFLVENTPLMNWLNPSSRFVVTDYDRLLNPTQ